MIDSIIAEALRDWEPYAQAKQRLKELEYCRTCRDPEAEFAEWLVARVLGGRLADDPCAKGHDVTKGARRIQVTKIGRASNYTNNLPPGRAGLPSKDAPECPTDYAYVLFDEKGVPSRVYVCPYEWISAHYGTRKGLRLSDIERESRREGSSITAYVWDAVSSHITPEASASEGDAAQPQEANRWHSKRDPVLRLLGTIHGPVPDISERHDELIGESLAGELGRTGHA